MGLDNRDYTRASSYERHSGGWGGLTANWWLILINSAILLLQMMSPQNFGEKILALAHFSTFKVTFDGGLEFWRFLTFQFVHNDLVHLFFNMFGLFIFGSMVEQNIGSKRYLAFYLVCGVFGGLMYLLLNGAGIVVYRSMGILVPGLLFNDPRTPLIGASAGVFGVIMACAHLSPNVVMQMIIPPVAIRLRTLAYAYVGLAALGLLFGDNKGGEAAHLGGAAAGYFFIRRHYLLRDFFDVFSDSRKEVRRQESRAKQIAREREAERKRLEEHEAEVNRILDKVRAQGLQSLTAREQAVLQKDTKLKNTGLGP